MERVGKVLLSIFFLPLLLTVDVFRSERGLFRKLFYLLLLLLLFYSSWISFYQSTYRAGSSFLYQIGVVDKLVEVQTRGTSMLPTVKDGEVVTLHSPEKYGLERGDIVSFKNLETGNIYYLKRIVGLEGEEVSIINGKVIINGQVLDEDYVFHDDPTFGNTFLVDCEAYTIPDGEVMVLGDNRIVSTDSRILGFVDVGDIEGVIKTELVPTFKSTDSSVQLGASSIDPGVFRDKLDEVRAEHEVRPLGVNQVLNELAFDRAQEVVSDFEGWKRQVKPITQLMDEREYQYLLVKEIVTFGYLDEQQLLDQILESGLYRDDFLSNQYYEFGIGVVEMEKGECRFPIITIILTWPSTPTYTGDVNAFWKQEVEMLSQLISGLRELLSNTSIDRNETQALIEELTRHLEIANMVLTRVSNNQWLTESELKRQDEYFENIKKSVEDLQAYFNKYQGQIPEGLSSQLISIPVPGSEEFNKLSHETKLLFGQGKYREQLNSANELLKLADNNQERAIAYYWRGLAQYQLNQVNAARSDLIKSTELDPKYAAPYVTLSAISFNEQNYPQGLNYALKCVELDPDYDWCHNNLGLAYLYLGQREKGISELEKAVSLDPTSYVFNDNLNRAKASR